MQCGKLMEFFLIFISRCVLRQSQSISTTALGLDSCLYLDSNQLCLPPINSSLERRVIINSLKSEKAHNVDMIDN